MQGLALRSVHAKKYPNFLREQRGNCYVFIQMWHSKISGFVLFSEFFRLREHGLKQYENKSIEEKLYIWILSLLDERNYRI